jgi:TRAP-type C4-dicarboxylate transport system substrate-binding protein
MAPYILTDHTVLARLPETALYKEWQTALEGQGIILVANMFNGFRNFYTTTQVTNLSDLQGLRIRGFGNAVGQALARYLGFTQITMNATEIYASIQTRALDGAELQLSTADSFRLFEVAPNLAITKHYMLQSSFVCGRNLLNTMSDEDKAFFLKTMNDMSVKYSAIIASEEDGYVENFRRNNGQVFNVNIDEFRRAIAPLHVNNDLGLTPGLQERLYRELGI